MENFEWKRVLVQVAQEIETAMRISLSTQLNVLKERSEHSTNQTLGLGTKHICRTPLTASTAFVHQVQLDHLACLGSSNCLPEQLGT